jgi:hypothetical protein
VAFEREIAAHEAALAAERHINFNATLQFSKMWCTTFELNPQENIWDEIREKIFKNYALKSMDEVCDKLEEAALYIERNPKMVKSIASFPYIVGSM